MHLLSSSGYVQPQVVGSVLFNDVISDASLTIGFSSGSTGLQVKFLASCLQGLQTICGPARKISVDIPALGLVGQEWTSPYMASNREAWPGAAFIWSQTALASLAGRLGTAMKFPPF